MQGRNQLRLHGKTSLSAIGFLLSMICVITLIPATAFSELQPVTRDGTFNLGVSISMGKVDGINVAVAGAGEEEAAYVLTRGVAGWSLDGQNARLTASDGAVGDKFGKTVALSDPFLIIGAPYAKSDSLLAGAAYIFQKGSGSSWNYFSKLIPANKVSNMEFAASVAIDGDYAVVGSPQDKNDSNSTTGAVYFYYFNGTSWVLEDRFPPPPEQSGASTDLNIRFGESVAISGNYAAVGASGYPNGSYMQGAVYIYELDGTWTYKTKILGTDYNYFGKSVSLDGDYLVVGAEKESASKGAAYIYERDASGNWNPYATQSKLTADTVQAGDAAEGDLFGSSVSVLSDATSLKVLVGAKGKNSYKGAAYYFDIKSAGSVFTKLSDSAAVANEQFGISGAVADEFLMVGANGYKNANGDTSGAVFVDLSDDSVNIPPAIEFTDADLNEKGQLFRNDTFAEFAVEFTVMDDSDTTLTITAIDVENITAGVTVVPPTNVNVNGAVLPATIDITANTPKVLYANVTPTNYGEALITVTAQDSGGKIAKASFTVFIKHSPTISVIPDQTGVDAMTEDTPVELVFTVTDLDYDTTTLEVSSSNLQLFDAAGMVLGTTEVVLTDSTFQDVTLTLTPVANANSEEPVSLPLGDVDITVKATDVGGSSQRTFTVHVNPDNDAPNPFTISAQTTEEDVAKTVTFTISDNETSSDSLIVTAASSNPSLVPDANLEITGTGDTRSLKITPAWDANSDIEGPATITITVSDGEKETNVPFQFTVTPVDDVPLICFVETTPTVQCADIPDQTINEDEFVEFRIKVHHGDEMPVTVTIFSGSDTVLPNNDANIDMNGNGKTYEPNLVNGEAEILVRLTPRENGAGSSSIEVNVKETGDSTQQSSRFFNLTVLETNDLPVVKIDNVTIVEQYLAETAEDTPIAVSLVLSDVDNLASELKIDSVTTQSPALVEQAGIAYGTTGGSNQTITITPFKDANSGDNLLDKATLLVTVTDGIDTVSFNIILTITPVNDAPEISGTPQPTVNQDVYYEFIPTVTDIENDNMSFTISNKPAWASFDPVTGKLSGTPSNDNVGPFTGIQITVKDDGNPNESATLPLFNIEVIDVNDPPTITTIFQTPEKTPEDTDWSKVFQFQDIDPKEVLTVSITPVTQSPTDLIEAVYVDDVANTKSITMAAGVTTGSVTLKIVPKANKYGTAAIKVSVDDGEAPAVEKTFAFEVTSVNDAPELTILDQENIMNEDETATAAKSVRIFIKDLDIEPLTVSLAMTESSPAALIEHYDFVDGKTDLHEDIVLASELDPATGESTQRFYVTLGENYFGNAKIQVTVTDDAGVSVSKLAYFTVKSVNDPPEVGNQPVSPILAYVAQNFTYDPQVTDPDEGDTLTYEFVEIGILKDSTGTTLLAPLPDWLSMDPATGILSGMPTNSDMAASGLEISGLKIRVKDAAGEEIIINDADGDGFDIDIKKIPLEPIISNFNPPETMQESKILYIPFTIADPNGDLLTLTLSSNATVLFPNDQAHLSISGSPLLSYDAVLNEYTIQTQPGQTYDLQLALEAVEEGNNEKFGLLNPITLTLNATDPDNLQAEEAFFMTVTAVEDPPTVSGVPVDLTLEMDQGQVVQFSTYDIDPDPVNEQFVNLMIGDADWDAVTATVEILSISSPTLFESVKVTNLGDLDSLGDAVNGPPPHQVILPYTDINGVKHDERPLDLIVTPAPHEHGTAMMRIKADDGKSAFAYSEVFTINVNDINDLPEITSVTPPAPIDEEGELIIPFTVKDWDVGDTLTINVYEAESDGTPKNPPNLLDGIVLTMDGNELVLPATITIDVTNVAQDIALELQALGATDQYGDTFIMIEVRDNADTVIDDFELVDVTINDVNDLPTITFVDVAGDPIQIAEVVINEGDDPSNGTPPFPLAVKIDDVEKTSVTLSVKVTLENEAEVLVDPSDFQLLIDGVPSGTLPVTLTSAQYADPAKTFAVDLVQLGDPNLFGKAAIELIASNDPTVEETILPFNIIVGSVADAPEFTLTPPNITLWEDDTPPEGETSINPVTFKVRDIDGGTLTLDVKSDTPGKIPNNISNLIVTGPDGVVKNPMTFFENGNPVSARYTLSVGAGVETELNLTVKPAADEYTVTGSPVTLTLELVDSTNESATPSTFEVTIKPVNDPPEIRELVNIVTIDMNTSIAVPFKVYDVDPDFTLINVYADKPAGSILGAVSVEKGAESANEVEFLLHINAGNTAGNASVTVHVLDTSDGQGQLIDQTVDVIVKENAVLTPDLITFSEPDASLFIDEGETKIIDIEVNYAGNPDTDLTFKVEKETLEVVGNLNITVGPRSSTDGLKHTYPLTVQHTGDGPFTDQNVSLAVTIIVQGTEPVYADSESFELTVIQVNDLPSFTNLPICADAATKVVETFENIPLDFSFKVRDPEGEVLYLDAEVISDPDNVISTYAFTNVTNSRITPPAPNIPAEVFMKITPEANITSSGEAIIQITVWDNINRNEADAVRACFTVRVLDSNCPLIEMDAEVLTNRSEPVTVPITLRDDHDGFLTVTAAWKDGSIANTSFVIREVDENDKVELLPDGSAWAVPVNLDITPGEISGTATIQINALDDSGKNCPKTITLKVRDCLEGDIDCNGTIALTDAIKGLQVLSGMEGIDVNVGADLNGDNQISLAEIIYVLRYIAGVSNP